MEAEEVMGISRSEKEVFMLVVETICASFSQLLVKCRSGEVTRGEVIDSIQHGFEMDREVGLPSMQENRPSKAYIMLSYCSLIHKCQCHGFAGKIAARVFIRPSSSCGPSRNDLPQPHCRCHSAWVKMPNGNV